MCGIVGAVAERDVVPILMDGLRRLEYRGYDSSGIAIRNGNNINRLRRAGKVMELQNALDMAVLADFVLFETVFLPIRLVLCAQLERCFELRNAVRIRCLH